MSYCFRVHGVQAPAYSDITNGIEVVCESGEPLTGLWQIGRVHRLYMPRVTTRSVEATLVDGVFSVRLFSGACREDYLLALDFAAAFARIYDREVVSEEGVRFVPAERNRRYGRGWIDDHIRAISKVILRMAVSKRPDEPLVVEGPIRRFHIGPRTAKAILEAGRSDLERAEVLFSMMQQVQYPNLPIVEPQAARLPDSERVVSAAFLMPETATLVSRAEFIAFQAAAPAHVPWEAATVLLGPYVRFLDEWTLAVAPIPQEAWLDLVSAAESFEMAISEDISDLTQHTWWSTQITDAPTEVFQVPTPRDEDTPVEDGVRGWWDVWRERR